MADELTPAELDILAKKLTPDQLSTVWDKFTDGERATIRKVSPTYIPPAPSGSKGMLDELTRYAHELYTGEGTARGDVKDYAKRELAGMGHMLDPRNIPSAAYKLLTHPLSPESEAVRPITDPFGYAGAVGSDMVQGLIDTGNKALEGDPEAVGNMLAVPIAEKAPGSIVRGANKVGTALATSEKLQKAIDLGGGSISGAIAAKTMGVSPFIGGIAGRNLLRDSGIPAAVGRAVETVTGGRRGEAGVTVPGYTQYGPVGEAGGVEPVPDAPSTGPRMPYVRSTKPPTPEPGMEPRLAGTKAPSIEESLQSMMDELKAQQEDPTKATGTPSVTPQTATGRPAISQAAYDELTKNAEGLPRTAELDRGVDPLREQLRASIKKNHPDIPDPDLEGILDKIMAQQAHPANVPQRVVPGEVRDPAGPPLPGPAGTRPYNPPEGPMGDVLKQDLLDRKARAAGGGPPTPVAVAPPVPDAVAPPEVPPQVMTPQMVRPPIVPGGGLGIPRALQEQLAIAEGRANPRPAIVPQDMRAELGRSLGEMGNAPEEPPPPPEPPAAPPAPPPPPAPPVVPPSGVLPENLAAARAQTQPPPKAVVPPPVAPPGEVNLRIESQPPPPPATLPTSRKMLVDELRKGVKTPPPSTKLGTAPVKRTPATIADGTSQAERPGMTEVRKIPVSKSSRSPRLLNEAGNKSPWTENDLKVLEENGVSREDALDPDLTHIPNQAYEALLKDRAGRASAYKAKAELDKAGGGEPPPPKATYLVQNQLDAAVSRLANNIVGQWARGNDALLNAAGPEMLKAVLDHLDATPGGGSKTLRAEVLKRLSK
jgi:hypothetical protein